MRDLAAILRGELESLEAELAADPRFQKAQKIRELLVMYGHARNTPVSAATDIAGPRSVVVAAVANRPRKIAQIRSAIRNFMWPRGSAVVARSRLLGMTETNNWHNTEPASVQPPKDSLVQPLSGQDALPPGSGGPLATAIPAPAASTNWAA